MNDTARQLRAQIPTSTDPDWLERMARHAEEMASAHEVPTPAPRRTAMTAADLSDSISNLATAVNTPGSTRR